MEKLSKTKLKFARELLREKKVRDENALFVAEGDKIVCDILQKGHIPEFILISKVYFDTIESRLLVLDHEEKNAPVFIANDAEFDKLSSLRSSQGIMAVFKQPMHRVKDLSHEKKAFLVLCDKVQDPANLGAIIRTSVAFEVDALLLAGETADIYNPKVVRASAGSMLEVPIYSCDVNMIDRLKNSGYKLFAGQPRKKNSISIDEIKEVPKKCIIAFGSEGKGISKEILERADVNFYIPISKKIESLNVNNAAAIALHSLRNVRDQGEPVMKG